MKEIGGYIELDSYCGKMLHEDGIKLNCGRNALAYLIRANSIKSILMPKFMCDSSDKILAENGVLVKYYSVGIDFRMKNVSRDEDDWLYIVNYYGQISNEELRSYGEKIIVDNAQAYFQEPIDGIDTLYICRKFFGVPDGSILYTKRTLGIELEQDKSFGRMHFLLGRYEQSASDFYSEYVANNEMFINEPIKRMSKLTENLLHAIDYNATKQRRTENFTYLYEKLCSINKLNLSIPEGAFMYPLYLDNGADIRTVLHKKKIFVPTLWPAVFNVCEEDELEYDMAKNILPLPIDQRYTLKDMEYLVINICQLCN